MLLFFTLVITLIVSLFIYYSVSEYFCECDCVTLQQQVTSLCQPSIDSASQCRDSLLLSASECEQDTNATKNTIAINKNESNIGLTATEIKYNDAKQINTDCSEYSDYLKGQNKILDDNNKILKAIEQDLMQRVASFSYCN